MTIDNYLCHTMARFDDCDLILEDIFRIYRTNELHYKHGPIYKMNDMCVAKNINWNLYRFYIQDGIKILRFLFVFCFILIWIVEN
jgi:hypothetical protein